MSKNGRGRRGPSIGHQLSTPKAYKRAPALTNSMWYKAILLSRMAGSADNTGAFDVLIDKMRRGTEPPPHIHSREDEFFYILSGEIRFYLLDAGGSWDRDPPGAAHPGRNAGARAAKQRAADSCHGELSAAHPSKPGDGRDSSSRTRSPARWRAFRNGPGLSRRLWAQSITGPASWDRRWSAFSPTALRGRLAGWSRSRGWAARCGRCLPCHHAPVLSPCVKHLGLRQM
jgi:hypothetical protein